MARLGAAVEAMTLQISRNSAAGTPDTRATSSGV